MYRDNLGVIVIFAGFMLFMAGMSWCDSDEKQRKSDSEKRCFAEMCARDKPPEQLKACIEAVADMCLKD